MKTKTYKTLLLAFILGGWAAIPSFACTGVTFVAEDGSRILARTTDWAGAVLSTHYVIVPRGHQPVGLTPKGNNGLRFVSKYGYVAIAVENEDFMIEGLNEKGLSAGLFFFPGFGHYLPYEERYAAQSLSDMQLVGWILANYSSVQEVIDNFDQIRVVGLSPEIQTVHWRIADKSGRQVVLEFVNGVPHFYENSVGVITNAPGFEWHLTNLNNYVNLFSGSAPMQALGKQELKPIGGNSGFLGLPGDATPPSRFVRAAFFCNTAPQMPDGFSTVTQSFHILNNFDIPIGIEHKADEIPDLPSATQWTSAIDLTNRKVYYKTAYNNNIRCIDLSSIDFEKVKFQWHPLDREEMQPIETIEIKQ
jgi:choloylglycine hydrolase